MIGNLKTLSEDELNFLVDKYDFKIATLDGLDYIVVKAKNYDRMVMHSCKKSFTLNTPIKKVSITPFAVNLWRNELKGNSLIRIQNAINSLVVTYQDISVEDIKAQLKRNDTKINIK